jgi:hypothetical protein
MKKMILIVSILFVFALTPTAFAQFGRTSGPSFYGEFKPVIGGWSEYQVTLKGNPPTKMKVAVVGKEGDAYWYETVMEGGGEGRMIMKILVSGDPENQKNIKRMIVKQENEPAMEMPVEMMQPSSKSQAPSGKVVDKGTETIKVPAGTFKTQHTQYQDASGVADAWIYKDVAPYGLIKSASKDSEMVLIGHGTGAKTQITETPQKFEMPQIPEGRPRKK